MYEIFRARLEQVRGFSKLRPYIAGSMSLGKAGVAGAELAAAGGDIDAATLAQGTGNSRRAQNAVNIQGTGLGLNIVSKYVELMNGSLDFESAENKGTTFTITLPQ